MIPPEEAEINLLSSIREPQDLTILLRDGVSEESFVLYGDVFLHVIDYARKYNTIPKHKDVELEYEDIGLKLESPGDLGYYANQVLDQHMIRQAHSAVIGRFGEQGTKLENDPENTIRLLAEDLRKMQRASWKHTRWFDKDAMNRLGKLREKAEAAAKGSVLGIPTGLRFFDDNVQGWGIGEAIMIMAPKGVGKSWLAMYMAIIAYNAGFKILFLSPEMSNDECELRFDVLLGYQVGSHISHSGLTSGQEDEAIYEDFLRRLSRRDQFVSVDSPEIGGFTASNIIGLIGEHRPDLVVLDGMHLVHGEPGQSGWEVIKQTSDNLKATAQHMQCSVIWTSQVDKAAMRNPTEPASSGASAAYGKASVEAANRLITLAVHDNDPLQRTFKVPNNRSGMEAHTRRYLRFDVNAGCIEEIDAPYSMSDDGESIF